MNKNAATLGNSTRSRFHDCPAPNCGKRVEVDKLACPQHWFALPAALRKRIHDAYNPGQVFKTASPEWKRAFTEALLIWRRKAQTNAR